MPEQGETYARFIEAELQAEDDRRAALDAKAQSLATTSSGFLALVFAIAALVLGKDHTLSGWAARGALVALGLYGLAALAGLMAGAGRPYERTSPRSLQAMVDEHWTDREVDARNIVANEAVQTVRTMRAGNNTKARLLAWGVWAQFVANVLIIVALAWELRSVVFA